MIKVIIRTTVVPATQNSFTADTTVVPAIIRMTVVPPRQNSFTADTMVTSSVGQIC
jgi:hypothetical protein